MAKKPNYQFDRLERDRQKAAKKAERLAAKQAKAAEKRGETVAPDTTDAPAEASPLPASELSSD